MKRALVIVVMLMSFAFARPAAAQQPTAGPDATSTTNRPWLRLVIFVPVSIALGAGTIVIRRKLRDMGWTEG